MYRRSRADLTSASVLPVTMSTTLEDRYAPALEETCRATLDERVREEVETLKSILMDDVIIKKGLDRPEIIETVIRPSTGCDVDQQYVCVTLEVTLPDRYPDLSPIVMLRNPRGLDDGLLETLHTKIKQMLHQHIGSVVIYSIVELLQRYLTNSNLPSCRCTICLFGFTKGDAFIKTPCYHYFHKHCLASHLQTSQQSYTEELEKLPNWKRVEAAPFLQTCPVCRSTVYYDVDTLKESPLPIESESAAPFVLTPKMRALQKKMAALFKKQEAKGGIVGTGDNGPPPLTITTPADFADGQGASGSRRGNAVNNRSQMNASPNGSNGIGRGSASKRGAIAHVGPQNIASTSTARVKTPNAPRGVTRAISPRGFTSPTPPRSVTSPTPPRGVTSPTPPRGVANANPSHGTAGSYTPRGFTNASTTPVPNGNSPHGVTCGNFDLLQGLNNASAPCVVAYAPTPPGISPSNALYNAGRASLAFGYASRGAIASANAGRGVISTASPPPAAPAPPPEPPLSPSGRPVYRGPYRGFNRRAKPGRRSQNSR